MRGIQREGAHGELSLQPGVGIIPAQPAIRADEYASETDRIYLVWILRVRKYGTHTGDQSEVGRIGPPVGEGLERHHVLIQRDLVLSVGFVGIAGELVRRRRITADYAREIKV